MRRLVISHHWNFTTFLITGMVLLVGTTDLEGQNSTRQWLQEADSFYDQEQWSQALPLYQNYLNENPEEVMVRMRVGEIFYILGHPKESIKELEKLIEQAIDIPPETYFYAGRASHQLGRFAKAEKYYRLYIEIGTHKKADLELMSYYLQQIGAAFHGGQGEALYYIENAGKSINSPEDEFHPVYSPNITDRFYYSRDVSQEDGTVPSMPSSMLYAEIDQGLWIHGGSLDPVLESKKKPFLLDFSMDGENVLFTNPVSSGKWMTFQKSSDPDSQPREWMHPYFDSSKGDRDLFTINDSAYLFSSRRWEGYGGYDLYVTFRRLGQWVVKNLGPVINSSYDEIAPFLSTNGRELYFSSNSNHSIGGYDVFTAIYSDEEESWTRPQNMLQPVNSGMDEVGMRLSLDGRRALFASNRPYGYGGLDIYEVYFEQERTSQHYLSQPRHFYLVKEYHSFTEKDLNVDVQKESLVYILPDIYFSDRPLIITPVIKADLDQLLNYSQLFPHTNLVVHIFSDTKIVDGFTLYRPYLLLKNVVDYLKQQGMAESRIKIRLYGGQYPLQLERDPLTQGRSGPSLNRRMEFSFANTEHLPVEFKNEHSVNAELKKSSIYELWKQRTKDLYFRIRLRETDQLLKGFLFKDEEDVMLEMDPNGENYTYFAGIFDTVADAKQRLAEFKQLGFSDAVLSAFIRQKEMEEDQITTDMLEEYPELKKYIIYQN